MTQLDLFGNPLGFSQPEPVAPIDESLFRFGGRPLRVVRVCGDDDAAPVIVEELADKYTLPGQYALWSRQGVQREQQRNARTETVARIERIFAR